MAEALKALQVARVVHCDISLQNILITPDGSLKLADFGEAQEMQTWGILPSAYNGLTDLKTPTTSPEIRNKSHFDSCADFFSLGAVLHMLLACKPEAEAPSYADVTKGTFGDPRTQLDLLLRQAPLHPHGDTTTNPILAAVREVALALLHPVGMERMTAAMAGARLRAALMQGQRGLAETPRVEQLTPADRRWTDLWRLECPDGDEHTNGRGEAAEGEADTGRDANLSLGIRLKEMGHLYQAFGNLLRARHLFCQALTTCQKMSLRSAEVMKTEDELLQLILQLNKEEARYRQEHQNRFNSLLEVTVSEEPNRDSEMPVPGGLVRPTHTGVRRPESQRVAGGKRYRGRARGPGPATVGTSAPALDAMMTAGPSGASDEMINDLFYNDEIPRTPMEL
jgi:serine/threonine protein kinase